MDSSLTRSILKKYTPLFIFATSMGFLEAIVVIYVRELYYPDGFSFPLKILPTWVIGIELIRELTTLFMLGAVAWISGKTLLKRLSVFLFVFGIWDIVYYVALKIFLNWPESIFTWDILFMIPITWIGPVIAPVICSVMMIFMTFLFEYFLYNKNITILRTSEYIFLLTGTVVIYSAFTYDFGMIIIKGNLLPHFFTLPDHPGFQEIMSIFVPTRFNWELFLLGILIIIAGIILFVKRAVNLNTAQSASDN